MCQSSCNTVKKEDKAVKEEDNTVKKEDKTVEKEDKAAKKDDKTEDHTEQIPENIQAYKLGNLELATGLKNCVFIKKVHFEITPHQAANTKL